MPTSRQAAGRPDQSTILKHIPEREFLAQIAPKDVANAPLPSFDPGVFDNELLKLKLYPTIDPDNPNVVKEPEGNIKQGTYVGTQVALTQAYSRIEQTFASLFDVLGIEPTLPRYTPLEEQRKLYHFSSYPKNPDGTLADYPPHLQTIPPDQSFTPFGIFNAIGLIQTQVILQKLTPDEDGFLGRTKKWLLEKERAAAFGGDPEKGLKIQDVVEYNKYHRKFGTDISSGGNIGLLEDWYSDRRFADQQFTGTNPATITRASTTWIDAFSIAAKTGGYDKWVTALGKADPASLFLQDGSYFRKACGVSDPAAVLHNKQPGSDDNWAVGAVSLFQLYEDGKLHPVAICVDHKGSMEKSVTIFNKRMTPADSTSGEKEDWPWRYAKTCAQVTDWMRHELTVHLTLSHLVEEAIIVATNRTIPMDHTVHRLLYPHWYKTLSLNAAARATLVPQVIIDLVGVSPEQAYSFIRDAFDTYDFVGSYVPNDLRRRGFPDTEEGLKQTRYKNYPYAKNTLALWNTLHTYVKSMLSVAFPTDASVAADEHIKDWAHEIKTAAFMPSFPEITTLDGLVDAVTMCIYIASPFHSAVNYLQNFYQAFVVARPPMLCQLPAQSLDQLNGYKETDLVASLPINRQREWLLAAQIPWLLSFKVEDDRSLLNYAASQWNVYKYKTSPAEQKIRDISQTLYSSLQELQKTFYYNSTAMDKGSIPYMVLDPGLTAVSILI
ncbi:lipoxygenase [Apodospora peruviana]|uniref:Manganese lipoxygenase n=1 Tax=Apodospora peruviana TaxID=516989 RepID=A0AAE0IJK8_9PEZI|nr:lipoxygenase [Apodospora peruviana]